MLSILLNLCIYASLPFAQALKSLKGLDSVLILLARAEAIRSLPDSDLEMALKDVKKAISIDPKNPFVSISLHQDRIVGCELSTTSPDLLFRSANSLLVKSYKQCRSQPSI